MHLVILRHTMDDVPLKLFVSRKAAEDYAEQVGWNPIDKVRTILNTDCSTPCSIAIASFDANGDLEKCDVVRSYDDEEANSFA